MQKIKFLKPSCSDLTPRISRLITEFCNLTFFIVSVFTLLQLVSCSSKSNFESAKTNSQTPSESSACFLERYSANSDSLYVLPFSVTETYVTGLTNCSSSFHSEGQPDQYAFDFNMPLNTNFVAARAGIVYRVVESASSAGGGQGNYIAIDHQDGSFALYYHSPENGIFVETEERVEQGQVLGMTGKSGLAGYPHLHFIVVFGSPNYPYDGMPVSFLNVNPSVRVLQDSTAYQAVAY